MIERKPEKLISFHMMKYIRPIWYFHLKPNVGGDVWGSYDSLSIRQKKIIQYDKNYSNEMISCWDASFQALMKGIIVDERMYSNQEIGKLKAIDLYRFLRKYYKSFWVYATFIQRLFLLYNPLVDLLALLKTRNIQRMNIFKEPYNFKSYPKFESTLIKSNPMLSIVIPTYNRYTSLVDLLKDLQKQIYINFEVIIIDQSDPFNEDIYKKINFKHTIIRQNKPELWRARNRGVEIAKSDYILLLDDDSRIESDWILEHLKCLDYFQADISSGVSFSEVGDKIPENYYYFRYSDQLDTGNVLIKKQVFIKSGLFDQNFEKMRMGDGEFGLRTYLNGFKNISNPKAFRKHLKIAKGGLRTFGHWDGYRTKHIFSPRPVPSVLYFYRKYWGSKAALFSVLYDIPFSFSPYYLKGTKIGYMLSLIIFILFFPFIIFSVIFSFRISTKMLKLNNNIKYL